MPGSSPSGDLLFYVSKTDAWDENGRLCKIGRVRVKFDPPLPVERSFRQELKLREGLIEIEAGQSRLQLWVDAKQPAVRLAAESATPASCRAEVELWRLRERPFGADDDSHSGRRLGCLGVSAHRRLPDVVATTDPPRVVWYHRNTRSIYPLCLKVQHLECAARSFCRSVGEFHLRRKSWRAGLRRARAAQALKSRRRPRGTNWR